MELKLYELRTHYYRVFFHNEYVCAVMSTKEDLFFITSLISDCFTEDMGIINPMVTEDGNYKCVPLKDCIKHIVCIYCNAFGLDAPDKIEYDIIKRDYYE